MILRVHKYKKIYKKDFRMAFKNYDKEGKGEIPSSMLGTVMKNLGYNLKPDQLQEAIEAVDSDGSGWIDFDEFMELMTRKTKEAQDEQELREAFRVFDKANTGQINCEDLKVIFKALDPNMSDGEVDAIITEVDEDGSGTLDFEGNSNLFFKVKLIIN
jgi:Ca2+-binding EF-hand superfamily protein